MPKPHSLSPAACLELLQLFSQRRLELSVETFEFYFDNVLSVLEATNNERFRLKTDEEE